MKYIAIFITALVLVGVLIFGQMPTQVQNGQILRIHIRANSNSEVDQNMKYQVKDALVEALIPLLAYCESKQEAYVCLNQNLKNIETIVNNTLKSKNFDYKGSVVLKEEYFPTRSYENTTLPSGNYSALVVGLGDASGDNWWCLVYPPLCFINGSVKVSAYKSRIIEIINSVFG